MHTAILVRLHSSVLTHPTRVLTCIFSAASEAASMACNAAAVMPYIKPATPIPSTMFIPHAIPMPPANLIRIARTMAWVYGSNRLANMYAESTAISDRQKYVPRMYGIETIQPK